MSAIFSQRFRNAKSMFQKLNDSRCISSFIEFKTQAKKQISELDKKKPSEFCKQCVSLRDTIIKKDKEFKACYADRSKQLILIEVIGEIKDFIDECSAYPQCFQKRLSRDRKHVELKHKSEKNCETNGNCKQTISTVPQKNKSPSRLGPEPRSTGSSQRQISQNPRGELEKGEKLRQQSVILEDQRDGRSAAITIEAKGEASESVASHHSGTPVPVVTSMQHSSPASSEVRELGIHRGVDPTHNISTQHSHSVNTWQTSDSSGKSPQHKLSVDQDSDGKTQNENIPARNIPGTQAHGDHTIAFESADGSPFAQIDSFSEEQGMSISYSDHLTTSDFASAEEKLSHHEGSDNASTDSEVSAGVKNNEDATRSKDHHNKSDYTPDVDQETHCIKNAGGTSPDGGTTCTETRGNELNNVNGNKLDILAQISNVIQSNPQIIRTSAPIGIALLLGLLFKYTPLWRVLTKKNSKKGAVINEELNSVVQEPSIMDDERSIPFSYGAFEYSSFDQNVY